MSTRPGEHAIPEGATLGEATMAFVQLFDAWMRRASVVNAGESVPRLRLLNELHCNGPQKMVDLADTLGVTPRAITALVDALEAEELVRRSPHPTDRRVTLVEITGGAATVERQVAAFESAIGDLFADIEDKDRSVLLRVLTTLRENIEAANG